ncbi:MIF4G-domain-containing protein [Basidiobolus meristosporus CBS 931.73]|uniref:MIF4G-domain-containing protein n=1 Tax=Basidiobolus meristosporus CBS 931.73 TaxID=1314790 RepID=A0A1Y1YYD8_9FUNG|nr:MIF4G-domain-containing protein [Basidiobolus meristosporus CBS 931.73]|eukprot:ORY02585.1 MIF4G-domain-containing protein [Basidiobolus meristosporus CBS 931.73]
MVSNESEDAASKSPKPLDSVKVDVSHKKEESARRGQRKRSRTPSVSRSRSRSRSPPRRRKRSPSTSSASSRSSSESRSRSPRYRRRSVSSSSRSRSPPRRHRSRRTSSGSRSRNRGSESRQSRSIRSPRRSSRRRSPSLDPPRVFDVNPTRRRERERQLAQQYNDEPLVEKNRIDVAAERKEMLLTTRTGGAYIPPARLRMMQESISDKSSKEYQRMAWETLKKGINGMINKVNTSNIKSIIPELFSTNLIRGRGLMCRSIMKAQAASLPFTPVYAAVIAVINTKMPQVGELLLTRLIIQFRRAFQRNDKTTCLATTSFIAHLSNQLVAHEILALQILALLLERPTDDSVEIAVGFIRECGAHLTEVSPKATHAAFERFRGILHEGQIDKRVQYMIEVLFQVRKDKFKDNPSIMPELDIVEEEDQITHYLSLDDEELNPEEGLGVFKLDPDYLENEEKYQQIKREILGDDDDDDDDDESGSDGDDSDESGSEAEDSKGPADKMNIHDQTNTNIINLRRTIYLTIMSSVEFQECVHKLMKLNIQDGQQIELANMIVECCSQERTYLKFYGLIGERFCKMNRVWAEAFQQCFAQTFEIIHQYETNRLRNVAKYFGHLLSSDAISWDVFSIIRLNEEDTTSSSRIFIKILFQDLSETLGLKKLNERLKSPTMAEQTAGLFPRDNPKNTRFAINYFTSINLGGLTDELREHLKNLPKLMLAQRRLNSDSSDSDSDSDSDSSSGSESDSSSSGSSSSGSDTDSSDSD